jgi:hypothetical protein
MQPAHERADEVIIMSIIPSTPPRRCRTVRVVPPPPKPAPTTPPGAYRTGGAMTTGRTTSSAARAYFAGPIEGVNRIAAAKPAVAVVAPADGRAQRRPLPWPIRPSVALALFVEPAPDVEPAPVVEPLQMPVVGQDLTWDRLLKEELALFVEPSPVVEPLQMPVVGQDLTWDRLLKEELNRYAVIARLRMKWAADLDENMTEDSK